MATRTYTYTTTQNTGGGSNDLQTMYQNLLREFQAGNNSQIETYRALLNDQNAYASQASQQRQQNEMALMNQQFGNMREMARAQAEDWLKNNFKLMSESSKYRSQESKQQFEQDRTMQEDKMNTDKFMQERGFKHDIDTIHENERVDTRRRVVERNTAVNAYKRF